MSVDCWYLQHTVWVRFTESPHTLGPGAGLVRYLLRRLSDPGSSVSCTDGTAERDYPVGLRGLSRGTGAAGSNDRSFSRGL